MKRARIPALILVLGMVLGLAACGKAAKEDDRTTEAPTVQTAATTEPPTTAEPYTEYAAGHSQMISGGRSLTVIFSYRMYADRQAITQAMVQVKKETRNPDGSLSTNGNTYRSYDIQAADGAFDAGFNQDESNIAGTINGETITGTISHEGRRYPYKAEAENISDCSECYGSGYRLAAVSIDGSRSLCPDCDGMGVIVTM